MSERWSAWHGCFEPRAKHFSQLLTEAWRNILAVQGKNRRKDHLSTGGSPIFYTKSPSIQSNFSPPLYVFFSVAGIPTSL